MKENESSAYSAEGSLCAPLSTFSVDYRCFKKDHFLDYLCQVFVYKVDVPVSLWLFNGILPNASGARFRARSDLSGKGGDDFEVREERPETLLCFSVAR